MKYSDLKIHSKLSPTFLDHSASLGPFGRLSVPAAASLVVMETVWTHQKVLTSADGKSELSAWRLRQKRPHLDLKRTLFYSCALRCCSSSRTGLHSSGLPPLHRRKLSPPRLSADIPHLQTEETPTPDLAARGR